MRYKYLILLLLVGCVGTYDPAANTPPTISANTTRSHCIALDVESDWGAPVAAGFAAASTGLGTMSALESKSSSAARVASLITGALGVVAGGVGLYASKSWHEECVVLDAGAPILAVTSASDGG